MWMGIIVLCIAGTTVKDLPGTVCIEYTSPPVETKAECDKALAEVMRTDTFKSLITDPRYDLDIDSAQCSLAI